MAANAAIPAREEELLDRARANDASLREAVLTVGDSNKTVLVKEALEGNTHLREIRLRVIDPLHKQGIQDLVTSFANKITALRLNPARECAKTCVAIASGILLLENSRLADLTFGNCGGPEGAVSLSKVLRKRSCSLKGLSMPNNNIRKLGAIAIGNALCFNISMEFLNIEFNLIGPEGLSGIMHGLEFNITLKEAKLFRRMPARLHRMVRENRDKEKVFRIEKEALMAEILGRSDRFKLFYYHFRNRVDLIVPGLLSRTKQQTTTDRTTNGDTMDIDDE